MGDKDRSQIDKSQLIERRGMAYEMREGMRGGKANIKMRQ